MKRNYLHTWPFDPFPCPLLTSLDKSHCLIAWIYWTKHKTLTLKPHMTYLKMVLLRCSCHSGCVGMTFWPSFAMTFDQFKSKLKLCMINRWPVLNPSIWYHTWHTLKVIYESCHKDMTFDQSLLWPLTYLIKIIILLQK